MLTRRETKPPFLKSQGEKSSQCVCYYAEVLALIASSQAGYAHLWHLGAEMSVMNSEKAHNSGDPWRASRLTDFLPIVALFPLDANSHLVLCLLPEKTLQAWSALGLWNQAPPELPGASAAWERDERSALILRKVAAKKVRVKGSKVNMLRYKWKMHGEEGEACCCWLLSQSEIHQFVIFKRIPSGLL